MSPKPVHRMCRATPIATSGSSRSQPVTNTSATPTMTAAEVHALDAGSWFNEEFAGIKVPSLTEVIKTVGQKARLMLSLPETRAETPWAQQLLEVLHGTLDVARFGILHCQTVAREGIFGILREELRQHFYAIEGHRARR